MTEKEQDLKEEVVEAEPAQPELEPTLEEKLKASEDKYLRLAAEFENYKKRSERDRLSAIKYSNESLLIELLPVLDHLEQALMATKDEKDPVVIGVKMVLKQFEEVLKRRGVEAFSALGKPFDHARHEAIAHQEDANVPEGQVISEAHKGYLLNGRLVRAARVVVAKAPAL